MKYEPITVQHPMIEPGNDGAIDEFERLLDEGRHEWMNRNKLIVEEAFQQLCGTLLRRLQGRAASVITPEAIAKIHSNENAAERRKLVRDICDGLYDSLRLDLIAMSGLPLRGRRREFSVRDGRIWKMRRTGLSYGRIGRRLGISRNAVQAACRRERQRRDFLCRRYADLRELLMVCGIILEAKPAN